VAEVRAEGTKAFGPSIRRLKYLLDLMCIPAWQTDLPTGYECNQKSWDNIQKIIPRGRIAPDPSPFNKLTKPFINIVDGLVDGFHPVYIPETPKQMRKKKRK
jgi:hypothetical protein